MRLSSLRLSNVRRFAKDVPIEFSSGVTILLAPNGTGKTAIFEAIELALTGAVARLPESLAPLIRDKQERAVVRLSFGDLERRVEVGLNTPPIVDGSLSKIFGETDEKDIPYLLRLTHLLDQHDRDWFVQADARTAGSHLSKLPIGRDAAQANSVIGGARGHFTTSLNQAARSLNGHKKELEDWQSLLQHRDVSTAEISRPLRPQDALAEELRSISSALSSRLPSPLPGLEWLIQALETLDSTVLEKATSNAVRIRSLASASSLIGTFLSDKERIARLELGRSETRGVVERLRSAMKIAMDEAAVLSDSLQASNQQRIEIEKHIKSISEIARAKDELAQRSQDVAQASEQLRQSEVELAGVRERSTYNEQILALHEDLEIRLQALQGNASELKEALQNVANWELTTRAIEQVSERITAIHEGLRLATHAYHEALAENAQNERSLAEAKSRLQAAASSSDAMRQAVTTVLENLSHEQGDCPVCGTQHGADSLREKIAAALHTTNPALAQAEAERQLASSSLERSEKAVNSARDTLRLERDELAKLQAKRTTLNSELDAIRSLRFVTGETAEASRAEILLKSENVNAAIAALVDEIKKAPARPDATVIASLRAAMDSATRRLESSRSSAHEASVSLADATLSFASIPQDQASGITRDDLLQAKGTLDREIGSLDSQLQAKTSLATQFRQQLGAAEDNLVAVERQIEEAQSRQASARLKWTQMQLPGEPSNEIAAAVEVQLGSDERDLAQHREALGGIGAELERWRRAEANRKAQSLVDSVRGSESESDRTASLQNSIKREASRAFKISQMSAAFDSLSNSLSRQIDEIQDSVIAIEPRWRSLIKRVVRDQRFANTILDYDNYYRKQRASVRIPLHDGAVPALSIASEAQLTDLQLTFLLSMAVSHRWTNWKALLLDDPTQHHDLVHAAAVFDVLRDYVVDHGFQIVIATHDSLQARFLLRKLHNDGIEAKLWALTPTDGGVTAKPAGG